jgi:hypothetical protein
MPLPGTPAYRGAWQETIKAAEAVNDPGRFTACIGFEWTSNTGGNNPHRNVIFRDNAAKAILVEPYTTIKPLGSDNPSDLWKWMAAYGETHPFLSPNDAFANFERWDKGNLDGSVAKTNHSSAQVSRITGYSPATRLWPAARLDRSRCGSSASPDVVLAGWTCGAEPGQLSVCHGDR